MKRFIYSIAALVAVFCWGCSNHALEDIQETSSRNDDVKMLSLDEPAFAIVPATSGAG